MSASDFSEAGPVPTGTDAQHLFDRVCSAGNDEQLVARLGAARSAAESDASFAAGFGSVISANEYAWLAVMQRVFNEAEGSASIPRMTDVARLLFQVAGHADAPIRTSLIATKLSSVLTVASSQDSRYYQDAAQCVLTCAASVGDVEAFLQRMQGFENVARFCELAPFEAVAMLVGTLVGRAPKFAATFCEHGVDRRLLQMAFKQLPPTQALAGALKLSLYAMRYFVRTKPNDFAYAERCLSLSAHSAVIVPQASGELAVDVCAVTTSLKFVTSHPNILANLTAGCPRWRGQPIRRIVIVTLLAKCVSAITDRSEMAKSAVRSFKACAALVDPVDDGFDVIGGVLHLAQCLIRCLTPALGVRYLDCVMLRTIRLRLSTADLGNAQVLAVAERWWSLVWTLRRHAFCADIVQLLEPWGPLVDAGVMTPETLQRITGAPLTREAVGALDAEMAARAEACAAPVDALVSDEAQGRRAVDGGENLARQKFARHFSEAYEAIRSSNKQRYFDAMVLPGCLMLNRQLADARQRLRGAEESLKSDHALPESVTRRHAAANTAAAAAVAATAMQSASATAASMRSAEVTVLPLVQTIETSTLSRRAAWRAKLNHAVHASNAQRLERVRTVPGAWELVLLQAEEELSRGFGWLGVHRLSEAAANRSITAADGGDVLSIAVRERLERHRIEAMAREAGLYAETGAAAAGGGDADEFGMSSPEASIRVAGRGWRRAAAAAGPLAANGMQSITAIDDATLEELRERFQANTTDDPFSVLKLAEAAARVAVARDAMTTLAGLYVTRQEQEERFVLVASVSQFHALANIVQTNLPGLSYVLRELANWPN